MNTSELAALLAPTTDERPVHFMGVGGAGMSALAELLVRRGVAVNGCDASDAGQQELIRAGIPFMTGHDTAHVRGARALVVTAAIPRGHPEIEAARAAGIPVVRRADALGAAVSSATTVVAVAGTHGKTTTTALTTDALAAAGLDPTGLAGGRVAAWGGHLWRGGDDVIVVEADEYDRAFLSIRPDVATVTNVEEDHLDIYSDIGTIRGAFEEFISHARYVIACADSPVASSLALPVSAEVVRYGLESGDSRLRAVDVTADGIGCRFTVRYDGDDLGSVRVAVPGRHNVLNSLAAIACGLVLGFELEQLRPGIEGFAGVERRFQIIARVGGVTVVDDYAHHPTEIAATLDAARSAAPGARVVAAFQPHLYSRTRDFAVDFATALSAADAVFLTDIYAAREAPIPGVSSAIIADAMERAGRAPLWQGSREDLAGQLARHTQPGDVVLTLGAGDITRSAYELRDLISAGSAH